MTPADTTQAHADAAVAAATAFWKTGMSESRRGSTDVVAQESGFDHTVGTHAWCGMFVAASYARAGLCKALRKGFYEVTNVRDYFTYAYHERTPGWVWDPAADAWRPMRAYHVERGAPRQWLDHDAIAKADLAALDIRPGDVALIDHQGDGKPDHITLVEGYDPKTGVLVTLEGNGAGQIAKSVNPDGSVVEGHADADAAVRNRRDLADPKQRKKIYGVGRLSAVDFEALEYQHAHGTPTAPPGATRDLFDSGTRDLFASGTRDLFAPDAGDPFTLEQQMLTLALASYRGFSKAHLGGSVAGLVDDAFLASLEPLGGRWKLAWGPVAHRPRFGLLDDAMMFVARDVSREGDGPARLAVVIRGTNPVSTPDWILGDLWAAHTAPWRGGAEGERVSLSTSLGLSILQGLRGEPAEGGRGLFSAAVKAGVNALLEPLSEGLAAPLRQLRAGVRSLAATVVPAPTLDAAARAEALLAARASGAFASIGAAVERASALAEREVTFDLYRFLEDGERLRAQAAEGEDVATFLRAQTDAGRPVEVWVTGHSKGAALAVAAARWLVDTQGRPDQWDPDGVAEVHCAAFAGPTAGNGVFAAGVDRALAGRLRHVVNDRDLVTRGWDHAALAGAASIFAPAIAMPGALARLADAVAGEVKANDYRHVDVSASRFAGDIDPKAGGFLEQVLHQHLEAYIAHVGLPPSVTRARLFGGG